MKKLLYAAVAIVAAIAATACQDDDVKSTWDEYADWRKTNISWLEELQARKDANGQPYYEVITPSWYTNSYVLVHRFGASNTGNLMPKSNSTIDVIYQGFNCEGERFDSSLTQTTYGPGIARFNLNEVIDGWTAAFETMHVGDSAEIICPYSMAYGDGLVSSLILPYSALRFNVRLVNIYGYEKQ